MWEAWQQIASTEGVATATFAALLIIMHAVLFGMYRGRLSDYRQQVKRLRQEADDLRGYNKALRDRFTDLMNERLPQKSEEE